MCRIPLVNVAYEFVLSYTAVPSRGLCDIYDQHVLLGWFARWKASGRTAAVLWDAPSRICSKQALHNNATCYLTFSAIILLESRWCNYTVVPIRLQLRRNAVFTVIRFLYDRQPVHSSPRFPYMLVDIVFS